MKPLVALTLLLVTGCAERMIARANELCTEYGFTPGTRDHAFCVEKTVSDMDARMQAGFARMGVMGYYMMQNSQPVYAPAPVFSTHSYDIKGQRMTCTQGPLATNCQ